MIIIIITTIKNAVIISQKRCESSYNSMKSINHGQTWRQKSHEMFALKLLKNSVAATTQLFRVSQQLTSRSFLFLEMATESRRSLHLSCWVRWVPLLHWREFPNKQASYAKVKHILSNTSVKVYRNCLPEQKEKCLYLMGQFFLCSTFHKRSSGKLIRDRATANLDRALRELIYIYL